MRRGTIVPSSRNSCVELAAWPDRHWLHSPDLTEVVLLTALALEGVEASVPTFAELASDDALRDRLRATHQCVFASSTLPRGLSEVDPLLWMLKRPHNRVVLGGALASILHHEWPGHPCLDLLAVGYGEMLVPSIIAWMRSGFRELRPPTEGASCRRTATRSTTAGCRSRRSSPPDFYWPAPFSPRVEYVPILQPESRQKCGIQLANDGRSSQPYWRHATMCRREVGAWYRRFSRELMQERISLHAGLFYDGILTSDHADRDALLDFQADALTRDRLLSRVFVPIHDRTKRRLVADVRQLGPHSQAPRPRRLPHVS